MPWGTPTNRGIFAAHPKGCALQLSIYHTENVVGNDLCVVSSQKADLVSLPPRLGMAEYGLRAFIQKQICFLPDYWYVNFCRIIQISGGGTPPLRESAIYMDYDVVSWDETQMMRLILKTTLVCHPERSRRILKVPGLALNNRGAKCRYEFVRILDMSCGLDMLLCGNEDTTPPSRRCRATSPTLQGRLLIVTIHTEFIDFILIKSL